MTLVQLQALAPILIVAATAIVVMLGIAAKRIHSLAAGLTIGGLVIALAVLMPSFLTGDQTVIGVTDLIVIDAKARLGMVLVLVTTLGIFTLCPAYFDGYHGNREEIYLLLVIATLGALTLTCANHASTLLIGLELLSLPMVAGVAYWVEQRRSVEGGIKYLILSAAASATLLFGLALIYADIGALDIATLAAAITRAGFDTPLIATGAAMLLAGLAFKLSLVPFHQWTPDVYEAAPTPITAYLATVVKLGAFIVVTRLFHAGAETASPLIVNGIVGLAFASMLVGSVMALRATNLKRLLAYSSIVHFGYLAVLLTVPGNDALRAAGVYLAGYLVASIGVFGVMTLISSPMQPRDREELDEYRGLFWRRPTLAAMLGLMLLSLAGIPLTIGFIGKFVVIGSGVQSARWLLVAGVVVASAISVWYYLRVMGALLADAGFGAERTLLGVRWNTTAGGLMLFVAMLTTLWFGIYPQPLFVIGGQIAVP